MRRLVVLFAVLALALTAVPAGAQDSANQRLEDLKLSSPVTGDFGSVLSDLSLRHAEGPVKVSIRLATPSVAEGGSLSSITAEQASIEAAILSADSSARIIGSVQRVLNAVFAEVDASALGAIASEENISSIRRVADYELEQVYGTDLTETVPYIGGSAVQDLGYDGSGVKVAVLDSGVDFTHASLGGPGTVEAYEECYGVSPFDDSWTPAEPHNAAPVGDCASFFGPGAPKVVGGYDFVGELWPFAPEAPDANPIDLEGHGTHVADIIGGLNGVAPGADIYAVKVCSAVSTSCSGIALIQGMDYAVAQDVDVINMSLGSVYGQAFDDDLAQAVENATSMGVLTVASAGNSADKPYVTGTPAAAPSALSVAQTQTPSANLQLIDAGEVTGVPAVFQEWSAPLTSTVAGELVYGDGAGGNLLGCDPFTADLTGKVVLVDRGACSFSAKIANVANAGGVAGIIGLVAPGAPFAGGFDPAGCADACDDIPGYMISQADSTAVKGQVGATATIDPANQLALVGQMVGSSSRGPSMQFNLLKPEIGAPGASVSAEVGTGTGTTPFGGTSGAAPMVSGSAALLLQAEPGLIPAEVKARLINTGETEIYTDPFSPLAPVSRIGGGEVRVNRAVESSVAAWDKDALQGALSFGFDDVTTTTSYTKTILVKNYGSADVAYTITPTFRYGNDASTGAVTPSAPGSITVPAGGTAEFDLTLTIDPAKLHAWAMNSGSRGANPDPLTLNEFDGYVVLDAEGELDDIHLPWHVLPRRAADVDVALKGKNATLTNAGAGTAVMEVYDLLATSDDLPPSVPGAQQPIIDLAAVGMAVFPVPAGFCSAQESAVISFAVNTHERQTHANAPALFEFDLDVNGDGSPDYAVYNADLSILSSSFNLSDGRNVVVAQDLATGDGSAFFFTDHQTNSANTVLNVCAEQIGIDGLKDVKRRQVGVALAVDIYFTGDVTDFAPVNLGAGLEQPAVRIGNTPTFGFDLEPGDSQTVRLFSNSAGEEGALILIRDGAPDGEEAVILTR